MENNKNLNCFLPFNEMEKEREDSNKLNFALRVLLLLK